jgi:hypothetical protein
MELWLRLWSLNVSPVTNPRKQRERERERAVMRSVALPFVGMMMAECAQVGLMIVAKAAMTRGMSNLVFIFYSNAFASLILLPTSFLFHRSSLSLSRSLSHWVCQLTMKTKIISFFGYTILADQQSALRSLSPFSVDSSCSAYWGEL